VAAESIRTKYVRALRVALQKHYESAGLPISFQLGEIQALSPQDRDIGCVWFEGKRPHRDANNEDAVYHVRVFRRFKQDQGGEQPRDEVHAELLRTFEILEDALAENLVRTWLETNAGLDPGSLGDHGDLLHVTAMTKSDITQSVTADLVVWSRNRTARGG
jgi:hypothetical protein